MSAGSPARVASARAVTAAPVDRAFRLACHAAVAVPVGVLSFLLLVLIVRAWPRLNLDFLLGWPSRHAERAGVLPALAGTLALAGLVVVVAVPVGVSAAVFLEELAPRSRFARVVELALVNLAAVPSILFGLLGLFVFVRTLGLGRSVLSASLTLALLVLPVIVVTAREALRAVPRELREAGLALGASPLQVVRGVVLPHALPGILTGVVLAVARAVGETAPILVIGALTFITFLPTRPLDPFAALPLQIYGWVLRPTGAFGANAAAGIVLLLLVVAALDAVVVVLRLRQERREGGQRS